MSTSFQAFPPPLGVAYPTTTTTTTTDSGGEQDSSEQSSGSFGMVFVVLAIILVVSSIACVLGRFCTKKSNKSNQPKPHKQKQNHNHNHHNDHKNKHNKHDQKNKHNNSHHKHGGPPPRPKDRDLEFGYRSKEGDIMLGFDQKVKIPSSKVANYNGNGDFRGDSFGSGRGMEQHGGGNYMHGMHNFKGDHSFGSGRGNFNMPRDYP